MRNYSEAIFTTRQNNNRLEQQLQPQEEEVTAGQRIKWKNINSLRSGYTECQSSLSYLSER